MKFLKDKDLLIRVAAVMIVLVVGVFVLQKVHQSRIAGPEPKAPVVKKAAVERVKGEEIARRGEIAKRPVRTRMEKPSIPKDKGMLTVKLLDSSGAAARYRIGMFKMLDSKTGLFTGSLLANRPQVFSPGKYDIVVETRPKMIYKGVNIKAGEETVLDLGALMGSLTIKMLDSRGNPARYAVSIKNTEMQFASTRATVNRKTELYPGVYDIQVSVIPAQVKKGIKIVAGKNQVVVMGSVMGSLTVKAIGKDGKLVRYRVRVKKAGTNRTMLSTMSNRGIELVEGAYDIDLLSKPPQIKKGVVVKAGEEVVIEVAPPAARPAVQPPAE